MKAFDVVGICAILVLVILGILLVQGRDSLLVDTFVAIAGAIFLGKGVMSLSKPPE